MPFLNEDKYVDETTTTHPIKELDDCSIAVDASYYLKQLLDTSGHSEPLLSALGGLTGIYRCINEDLDSWQANNVIPFFIFDGQSTKGQDETTLVSARAANRQTDEAWSLYSRSMAEEAVITFGESPGAFPVHKFYPILQELLKERELHFIVAPYSASAQLAYFETIDSDQCAGVMGSQELLLYPINDSIIRGFDWEKKIVKSISKKRLLTKMGVSEPMFIDAFLMSGTSFLPAFPPLEDKSMFSQGFTVDTAANILRTEGKVVANACSAYNDIVQRQDPEWLDKYQKARMAVQHFIYIAESGEVRVNDFEHLTSDNHEYLGLQLPGELFHYLNTGLVGPRIMNSITHGQIVVQPTLDGSAPDDYKKLVSTQLIPIEEQTLALIIPRVHRGIAHKPITKRVWYDAKFSHKMAHGSIQPPPSQKVGTWDVKEEDVNSVFPQGFAGPVALEVLALYQDDFVSKTFAKGKSIKGIDSAQSIISVAIWRFLHLRGYVNDKHKLTNWGNALAATLMAFRDDENSPAELDEAALLAFELIRFGVLNGSTKGVTEGLPRNGTDEDKANVLLIARCAALLRLQHQTCGYTGPLNKNILAFRSLSSAVRQADRDLLEAIVASMFLYGQSKRERADQLEIHQQLPFLKEPDVTLGIAVQTFFDEEKSASEKAADRQARLDSFPGTYVPYAEDVASDIKKSVTFVRGLYQGLELMDAKELPSDTKKAFANANAYLEARPF